jgi:hypothetical protein
MAPTSDVDRPHRANARFCDGCDLADDRIFAPECGVLDNWRDLAEKIARIGAWEFEDYTNYREH